MDRCSMVLVAAMAGGSGLPIAAQGTISSERLPMGVVGIHTAPADPTGGSYGTWGAGSTYKASFHEGVKFVPLLGPDYPKNQPWRWKTLSVTIGEKEFCEDEPQGYAATDVRYEYALGGVLEAYDLLEDGLEQTFVIDDEPGDLADLVVMGKVETELEGEDVQGVHGAVKFRDENGQDILSYGAAILIDAQGQQFPMETTFEDGVITLRLDENQLAQAVFPVVVDPVVTTELLASTPLSSYRDRADVVREPASAQLNVWVCYSRWASYADSDMFVVRRRDGLGNVQQATVFRDVADTWSTRSAQLAYVAGAGRVVCSFERSFSPFNTAIRWHAHHVSDTNPNERFGSIYTFGTNHSPDIGGTVGIDPSSRGLIAWQHDPAGHLIFDRSEIHAAVIDFGAPPSSTDQGTFVHYREVRDEAPLDCEAPSVTKAAETLPSGQITWGVAHSAHSVLAVEEAHVEVSVIDDSGTILGQQELPGDTTRDQLSPQISGISGRYLVGYESVVPTVRPYVFRSFGDQLHSIRVDWNGGFTFAHSADVRGLSSAGGRVTGLAHHEGTRDHWMGLERLNQEGHVVSRGHDGQRSYSSFAQPTGDYFVKTKSIAFDSGYQRFLFLVRTSEAGHPLYLGTADYSVPGPIRYEGTACIPWELQWTGSRIAGTESVLVRSVPGAAAGAPRWQTLTISFGEATSTSPPLWPLLPGCELLVDTSPTQLISIEVSGAAGPQWAFPLSPYSFPLYLQAVEAQAGGMFGSTRRMVVPIIR